MGREIGNPARKLLTAIQSAVHRHSLKNAPQVGLRLSRVVSIHPLNVLRALPREKISGVNGWHLALVYCRYAENVKSTAELTEILDHLGHCDDELRLAIVASIKEILNPFVATGIL